MDAERKDAMLAECRDLMAKASYDGQKTEQFIGTVSDILQECVDHADERREVTYEVVRHFDCVEVKLNVSGDRFDPMSEGSGVQGRRRQRAVNRMLLNPETSVSVTYSAGWNHIVVRSPSRIANSKLLTVPMLRALPLGAIAGLLVRFLPEDASGVVLNDMAMPLLLAILQLLMGIMGPVFFLYIVVAVSSFGSAEEMARIEKVIATRFVLVTLWVTVLTITVAAAFFPVFGKSGVDVSLPQIEGVLLGLLPKDIVTPFSEGNMAQIIMLSLICGTGLLMMGDGGAPVREALIKGKEWAMGVMALMMKVMPLVPFISTMLMVGSGNAQLFLKGWKYIVAAYVCYLASTLIELVVVSVRSKTSIRKLLGMLKQTLMTVLLSGNKQAAMQACFKTSKRDLHIDGTFADMWVSLASNLLSPSRTISLVLSVFFIADITGSRVDTAVILIMLLTVVELSLASPETVAAVTVLLETLKMPTDMVGIFSAFDMFTKNVGAAYDVLYSMLEQLDAARGAKMIEEGEH